MLTSVWIETQKICDSNDPTACMYSNVFQVQSLTGSDHLAYSVL
uniref:Uncharacterized protein n=1 Tax=Arundo donax TaxID=35708 RepID=A0A0A9B5V5_ARUDO